MSINKLINKINWRTTAPITTMNIGYENDKPIPVPKEVLSYKLNIKKGDRVVLVYYNSQPAITCQVMGKTILDLFKSINSGMKSKISPNNTDQQVVYGIIGNFIKSSDRLRLIKLYETNKLTPYDLVIDNYDFYEGNLKKTNGIWTYAVGS